MTLWCRASRSKHLNLNSPHTTQLRLIPHSVRLRHRPGMRIPTRPRLVGVSFSRISRIKLGEEDLRLIPRKPSNVQSSSLASGYPLSSTVSAVFRPQRVEFTKGLHSYGGP